MYDIAIVGSLCDRKIVQTTTLILQMTTTLASWQLHCFSSETWQRRYPPFYVLDNHATVAQCQVFQFNLLLRAQEP